MHETVFPLKRRNLCSFGLKISRWESLGIFFLPFFLFLSWREGRVFKVVFPFSSKAAVRVGERTLYTYICDWKEFLFFQHESSCPRILNSKLLVRNLEQYLESRIPPFIACKWNKFSLRERERERRERLTSGIANFPSGEVEGKGNFSFQRRELVGGNIKTCMLMLTRPATMRNNSFPSITRGKKGKEECHVLCVATV